MVTLPTRNYPNLFINLEESNDNTDIEDDKLQISDYIDTLDQIPSENENCEKSRKANISTCKNHFSGFQGTLYADCKSPLLSRDRALKIVYLKNLTKLHDNSKSAGAKHDLTLFKSQCTTHNKINELKLPNLVNIYDCWYCKNSSDPEFTTVNVIQEYIQDATPLYSFLYLLSGSKDDQNINTKNKRIPSILSIIIQVITTVDELYKNNLYHNDLHIGNILLIPWPSSLKMEYKINNYDFKLNSENSQWFVKIIDYGMATNGYQLDNKYLPDLSMSTSFESDPDLDQSVNIKYKYPTNLPPWIDIAQFLNGFKDINEVQIFKILFDSIQNTFTFKSIRETAKAKVFNFKSYISFLTNLYNLYKQINKN